MIQCQEILILTTERAAVTREHEPAVADRIRAILPDMPSAVARVADYLLREPQAPLTLSIGDLAERAATSAATVTRFCRMIGYSGYVEMRVGIATEVGRRATVIRPRTPGPPRSAVDSVPTTRPRNSSGC